MKTLLFSCTLALALVSAPLASATCNVSSYSCPDLLGLDDCPVFPVYNSITGDITGHGVYHTGIPCGGGPCQRWHGWVYSECDGVRFETLVWVCCCEWWGCDV
jgi:hypothetical protein